MPGSITNPQPCHYQCDKCEYTDCPNCNYCRTQLNKPTNDPTIHQCLTRIQNLEQRLTHLEKTLLNPHQLNPHLKTLYTHTNNLHQLNEYVLHLQEQIHTLTQHTYQLTGHAPHTPHPDHQPTTHTHHQRPEPINPNETQNHDQN